MFTFIYALGLVNGAGIFLAFCIICLLIACLVAFAMKANRGKNVLRTVLTIAASAALCDAIWFFIIYFPGGNYAERGLAVGLCGLLLYPCFLALGIAFISYINKIKSNI